MSQQIRTIKKIRAAGEHVRLFYKFVTGSPTNEEEERHYQYAVTLLHYSMYGVGGLYFSKDISKPIKYSYAILNVLAFTVLTVAGNVYYTLQLLSGSIQFDLFQVLSSAMMAAGTMTNFIFFPLFALIYWTDMQEMYMFVSTFKAHFRRIKFNLENDIFLKEFSYTHQGHQHNKNRSKGNDNNIVLYPLLIYVVSCIGIAVYQISPMLNYAIFLKNERLPEVADYNVVPLFYDCIQSFSLYLCTAGSLFIFTLLFIINVPCLYPLFMLLSGILENNAQDICAKMDYLSHSFVQVYETIQEHEVIGSEEIMYKNQLFSAFEKDINVLKKEYEKYRKYSEQFQMFISPLLNVIMSTGYSMLFALTAILVVVKLSPYQFVSCIGLYAGYVIGVFIMSQIGKIFEDVGESFRYAIYNLPWYYLTPKTRKLVSLLQSVVHQELEFRILAVYPMNMAMFPRVLNSTYSYANLLRAVKL